MIPPSWTGGELCMKLSLSLGHFLWQGTAVALLASLILACLRRASSRVRYGVSVIAMGLMALCLPLTLMSVHVPRASNMAERDMAGGAQLFSAGSESPALEATLPGADQPHSTAAVARTGPQPIPARVSDRAERPGLHAFSQFYRWAGATWPHVSAYVVMCYLLGVLGMFGRLVFGLRGGSRLRQLSLPAQEPQLLEMLARQAKALGLSFTPAVAYCEKVVVPTVVGVVRPAILLPVSVLSGLSSDQVEALLAHELAHIRRFDHLVNLAQRVVEAVLFFHPAMWIISRRIRIERENCCDDIVVASGGEAVAYAASLVRMAELSRSAERTGRLATSAALMATRGPSGLHRRVVRLLGAPPHESVRMRSGWSFVLGLVLIGGVIIAAYVNAWAAQSAATERSTAEKSTSSSPQPPEPTEKTKDAAEQPSSATWYLRPSLDVPNLRPPVVQYAIFDEDPMPAFKSQVSRMRGFYEKELTDANVATKATIRHAQMLVSWDFGFRDQTGDQIGILSSGFGVTTTISDTIAIMSSDRVTPLRVNLPPVKRWFVTKAVTLGSKVLCWSIPFEADQNRPAEVTLNEKNATDLEPIYDAVMSEKPDQSREGGNPTSSVSPAPTQKVKEQLSEPPSKLYFVRLVIGENKMTFEGEETTWDQLPKLLEKVPNRQQTVFELSMASDQLTVGKFYEAEGQVSALARPFGFKYLSNNGVHPLGSKGSAPKVLPDKSKSGPEQQAPATPPPAPPEKASENSANPHVSPAGSAEPVHAAQNKVPEGQEQQKPQRIQVTVQLVRWDDLGKDVQEQFHSFSSMGMAGGRNSFSAGVLHGVSDGDIAHYADKALAKASVTVPSGEKGELSLRVSGPPLPNSDGKTPNVAFAVALTPILMKEGELDEVETALELSRIEFAPAGGGKAISTRIRFPLRGVAALSFGETGNVPGGVWSLTGLLSAKLVSEAEKSAAPSASPAESGRMDQIYGRVTDSGGHPVPDARVVLYYNRNSWGFRNRVADQTRSAENGTFAVSGRVYEERLESFGINDSNQYWLFATHPKYAVGWKRVPPGKAGESLQVVLGDPGECAVTVVDDQGKPLEGARVWLHQAGDSQSKRPEYREYFYINDDLDLAAATTGPDGKARISNLPDTTLSFYASKEGYSDTWRGGRHIGDTFDFPLTRGGILRGQVTFADSGKPASGVVVWLYPKWRFYSYYFAETDQNGRYEFKKAPADGWDKGWFAPNGATGAYDVQVDTCEKTPSHVAAATTVLLQPGSPVENFDLKLEKGVLLSGMVKSADGDFPLPGCGVTVMNSPTGRRTVYADETGRYSYRTLPGHVVLFIESHLGPPGFVLPWRSTMPPGQIDLDNDVSDFDLLVPGAMKEVPLRVVVRDAKGQPARGAFVQTSIPEVRYKPRTGFTDAAGCIAFEGAGEGMAVLIYAWTPERDQAASTRVTMKPGLPEVVLQLAPASSVTFAVKNPDRTPASNLDMLLFLPVGPEEESRLWLLPAYYRTDAQGRIEVPGLLPAIECIPMWEDHANFSHPLTENGRPIVIPAGANPTVELVVESTTEGPGRRMASPPMILTPKPQSLIGKSFPDLKPFGLDIPKDGKPILLCFWSQEQRPSRQCMNDLLALSQSPQGKQLTILTIQAEPVERDTLSKWTDKLTVGMIEKDAEKVRASWGVQNLPWLVLAASDGTVLAEGFPLPEWQEILKAKSGN